MVEKQRYERLPPAEDEARETCHGLNDRGASRSKYLAALLLGVALGVATTVLASILALYAFRKTLSLQGNLDAQCAEHTAKHSPVLEQVRIKYEDQPFDGNFMQESVYRKLGSKEVDDAWEALGVDYRAGVISEEEGRKSGLTDAHVQVSEKYGGGFLVNVEGMHHLHCLNLVRKSLYFNIERYKALGTHAFMNDEFILRLHITHCLDTIRQVLMCNVDTAVLGQIWYNPQKLTAFPDFNTVHRCKNYEDVRIWAESMQAPPMNQTPPDFLKEPREEYILPSTP